VTAERLAGQTHAAELVRTISMIHAKLGAAAIAAHFRDRAAGTARGVPASRCRGRTALGRASVAGERTALGRASALGKRTASAVSFARCFTTSSRRLGAFSAPGVSRAAAERQQKRQRGGKVAPHVAAF
jgi:hypothetical protein